MLVPPQAFQKEWKNDYEAMRSTMVFGKALDFDALMERMRELERRFRLHAGMDLEK